MSIYDPGNIFGNINGRFETFFQAKFSNFSALVLRGRSLKSAIFPKFLEFFLKRVGLGTISRKEGFNPDVLITSTSLIKDSLD